MGNRDRTIVVHPRRRYRSVWDFAPRAGATMILPEFDADGNLPPGVYPVSLLEALARFGRGATLQVTGQRPESISLLEALARFGRGSPQRQAVATRLARIYALAASTGRLTRFVVFGSFVTAKLDPRDVDIVLIMNDAFDVATAVPDVAVVFRHADADAQLGASVFWATRSGALGGEQAMIEFWQSRRDGGLRGIIEIVSEGL